MPSSSSSSPIGGDLTNMSSAVQQAVARINEFGSYGYRPSLVGAIVFCIVYGLLAIILTFQGWKGKRWWLLATLAFGSWCECVGNGIRIYGHFHPSVVNPYIAQQVILVLTPAFFAAADFTILTKFCLIYDESFIRPIKAKWLIPFFVILDVVSLGVQGAGSGLAAVAEINGEDVQSVNNKGDIVVAGLAIQLAGYIAFNILFILFMIRVWQAKKIGKANWFDHRQKLFFVAVWSSALFVLGRSAFRTAEMASGWIGKIATTEWYYLIFDATFVALAVLILTIVSPIEYLPRTEDCKENEKVKNSDSFNSSYSTHNSTPNPQDYDPAQKA